MEKNIVANNKSFKPIFVQDEMSSSYLSYAMSVIVSRALPDVRDGLKPVHRRIIYAMYKGGYDWSKPFRKSARIVGDVIGKYHPHGDQSVYDALVRLVQDFSMSVPLITGQGNFGSIDGDPPAAMRYTETKLGKISQFLTEDLEKNTVIVVEHDIETMENSDHIIDIGPDAGLNGGQIVADGTVKEIISNSKSITGDYLSGKKFIPIPKKRRSAKNGRFIEISGASGNNLKKVNLKIPVGTFTCVTGVSGSGKSTLILHTLYNAFNLMLNKNKSRKVPKAFTGFKGTELIDKIIDIDQSPIGRTPRSNPATYTGAFGPIREWFAGLPESKARGYKVGRYSFNVKGGRCETCEGDGVITYEMHFLPDVFIPCDTCKGARYNRETLEIRFKNKNIADVLDMTVDEGCEFFENIQSIRSKLITLKHVGLGYMKIGQQATTLSGGEAQRIKLAKELSKRPTGRTLYILDEPTTGLHSHDIKKLLEILQAFANTGNTVVVIEHNLDVIKTADHIIDMGPEGGINGGKIIAEGTPEKVSSVKESYTGKFIKEIMGENPMKKTA